MYGSPHDGVNGLRSVPPVARIAQRAVADRDALALEGCCRPRSGRRRCRPAGRGPCAIGAAVSCARSSGEATTWTMSRCASLSATACACARPRVGQLVVGQSAVEDLVRVVHLAVAQHVHDRLLGHAGFVRFRGGAGGDRAARRRCARTRRRRERSRRTRPRTRSAAGTRRASSSAWKNGGKRHVSAACAPAKSCTGVVGEEHAEHVARALNLVRAHRRRSAPRRAASPSRSALASSAA